MGGLCLRKQMLPFALPDVTEAEIAEVVDTLRSGWLTTGPRTKKFERAFAEFVGMSDSVGMNSCTAALHTALRVMGVGPGDEVITTPMTFAASVNVIEHVGARPVLVDVEQDTLNIDPAQVEAAITARTRVVLPVHLAGHPVDMDPLLEIARSHNLRVLEDAAHALPARYKGKMIGSLSDATAFSFYATKNLCTGEGGALTMQDPELLQRARVMHLHGMSRDAWKRYTSEGSWFYEIVEPGFKYNLTDMQAALGLIQLRRLPDMQERRRALVAKYQAAFAGCDALQVPVERDNVSSAWHLYVLRLRGEALAIGRDQFITELQRRNVATSVHFIPIHLHPFYRSKYGAEPADYPVAFENYSRMLSLPLYTKMSDQDVADVAEAVLDIVNQFRR